MARLPYAARVLIDQATAAKPRTKVERVDEPDGFNVHRTIKFSKDTSKWLEPRLEVDPRIADAHLTDDGYLHVTFISGPRADDRTVFALREPVDEE